MYYSTFTSLHNALLYEFLATLLSLLTSLLHRQHRLQCLCEGPRSTVTEDFIFELSQFRQQNWHRHTYTDRQTNKYYRLSSPLPIVKDYYVVPP